MKGLHGIYAMVGRAPEFMGWAIYLKKYENGKRYKPKISIEWVESSEMERTEPIVIDKLDTWSSVDEESKLAGTVEAQKEEIRFLREELAKALAR